MKVRTENLHGGAPGWQRLMSELRRDKKKTVFMVILFVIACVVCGRLVVRKLSPEVARAASELVPPAPSAPGVGPSPESQAPAAKKRKKGGPQATAPAVEYKVRRDIFTPNTAFFPPDMERRAVAVATQPAGVETPAAVRERSVRAQAQALLLQSTVDSAMPTAIINALVLRKGEWINNFQVIEITSRACVVAKDGVKVTLEMKD